MRAAINQIQFDVVVRLLFRSRFTVRNEVPMRVDILSLLAGALAGLFAGHAIARGDPSSSQADGGAGTLQVLSSLATSNRINNQVLAGIGELKVLRGGGGGAAAGGEKVTGAQVAAAVKAAVAEAMREQSTLAGSSSALAAAAAVEAAAPCPAIPACPACPVQQPCPKCEAAATVTTAVAAENAGGGVGTDNVGADGTAINFASPFANQPGTIHELGCRRVGAGETQCTDKVGGNTADHKFARVPETGLGAPHGYDRWCECPGSATHRKNDAPASRAGSPPVPTAQHANPPPPPSSSSSSSTPPPQTNPCSGTCASARSVCWRSA
jgi:hypothetical protein